MLNNYIQKIFDAAKRGDDREESYYSCLENLFYDYSNSINKKNIQVTTLPKKTEAGNPDFRIWDGKQNIVGYIEAKKPTEKNLDIIETSEQLKRYLKIFPNMILFCQKVLIDNFSINNPLRSAMCLSIGRLNQNTWPLFGRLFSGVTPLNIWSLEGKELKFGMATTI